MIIQSFDSKQKIIMFYMLFVVFYVKTIDYNVLLKNRKILKLTDKSYFIKIQDAFNIEILCAISC